MVTTNTFILPQLRNTEEKAPPPLLSHFTYLLAAARQSGLSLTRLAVEQAVLELRHGVDIRAYYAYRLFEPHLPFEAKTRYLPADRPGGHISMAATLTPVGYRDIYRSKLMFNHIFHPLPLARIQAVYNLHVYTPLPVETLITERALDHWMRTTDNAELVYKPVYPSAEIKILVFHGRAQDNPGTFVTLTGERYDARRLVTIADGKPMLFQERLRNHGELAGLLGETLCCVRIVTIVPQGSKAQILGAVFRLQAAPLGVDHLLYGAAASWVEPQSGKLGPGRTRLNLMQTPTWVVPGSQHRTGLRQPDFERSFQGFALPMWDRVKELALLGADSIPDARAIGWDIAITDRGPVVLGGTYNWSTELLQLPAPYGLMTDEFKALCRHRIR